ncbi:MAG: 50S ribosomal protein L18 [Myxococcota bacterium]
MAAKLSGRARRRIRVRKKISGTADRPRLNVFRSAKHIYAQAIDDLSGTTLASVSTASKDLREQLDGDKVSRAKAVGLALAEACKAKNVSAVVFDRNGYKYHGRVRAVAEGAREGGLEF